MRPVHRELTFEIPNPNRIQPLLHVAHILRRHVVEACAEEYAGAMEDRGVPLRVAEGRGRGVGAGIGGARDRRRRRPRRIPGGRRDRTGGDISGFGAEEREDRVALPKGVRKTFLEISALEVGREGWWVRGDSPVHAQVHALTLANPQLRGCRLTVQLLP